MTDTLGTCALVTKRIFACLPTTSLARAARALCAGRPAAEQGAPRAPHSQRARPQPVSGCACVPPQLMLGA